MTVPTVIRLAGHAHLEAGEAGKRARISGVLLTYGTQASPSGPFRHVVFEPGALQIGAEFSRVKLLRDHDAGRPIGVMVAAANGEVEVSATFELGRGGQAAEALQLAQDGILDGLSVGVEVLDADQDADGVWRISAARLREVSLLAIPAFDDARLTDVAARKEEPMTAPTTATENPQAALAAAAPGVDLEGLRGIVLEAVAAQFAASLPAGTVSAVPEDLVATVRQATTARGATTLVVDANGYGRDAPAYVAANGMRITPGDYLGTYLRARRDGDHGPHKAIQAALAHQTTDLVPGLLPVQIIGPLIDDVEYIRRVWNSGTARVMPARGAGFQRPSITQHVVVGEQAAEKTEVPSQPMKVMLDDVAKATIAGALNLSVQAIDWTEPALLDLVIRDFARIYAAYTDTYAATKLAAGATGTPINADPASPAAVNSALYQAAAAVWSLESYEPNTMWMSVDVWAIFGGMVDGDARPLYPFIGPTNALGSLQPSNPDAGSVGGWGPVISPILPAGTLLIGDRRAFELYEDRRGFLRAEEPSVLGVQLAYYGYVANYLTNGKAFVPIKLQAAAAASTSSKSSS